MRLRDDGQRAERHHERDRYSREAPDYGDDGMMATVHTARETVTGVRS